MKIISASQIQQADIATINEQNIHSHELMERAARAFSNWYLKKINIFNRIHIICGTGNNGGDGLCIARQLAIEGINVYVYISGNVNNGGPDFKLNLDRLKRITNNIIICDEENFSRIADSECIIDALFGTGLNKPIEGLNIKVIDTINKSGAFVISVDIPSGVYADKPTDGITVNADLTFSFELPKLCFFFPENKKSVGEWIVSDIGLSKKYLNTADSAINYLIEEDLKNIIHSRDTFSHKGSYGHALIVAGKSGMKGAAHLSGYACLKTGAGLVTISSGENSLAHPELMMLDRSELQREIKLNKFNAVGIGPGLGTEKSSVDLLKTMLLEIKAPLVIDADALNIIADNKELMEHIAANSILTPHPKEFERLFGKYEKWTDLIDLITNNSKKYKIIIIYKRAYSIIALPDGTIYFNSTGNSGMATAGSGDVLTGILTSLLAQKYLPGEAALLGTYLHGLAGDLAMLDHKGQNIVAGELIDHIQDAFNIIGV